METVDLPDMPKGSRGVPHARALDCWNRSVTARAEGDTITILSEIGENWDGTGVTPGRIEASLRAIGAKPVTVIINSPGGNFFDGLAIYNLLRNHAEAVTVQIVGLAGSAASVIAMAGDVIQIAKAGLLFVHNTQWVAIGDRNVMLQAYDDMKVFDEISAKIYADRTGIPVSTIASMLDAETFISGESAVAQKFADALLPTDEVVEIENNGAPAYQRVAAALSKAGMPRSEIRKNMKELSQGMPGAALDPVMPGADDTSEFDGLAHLRAAAMKLSLNRA